MQITSNTPVPLVFKRNGGTVITGRLDFWRATPQGWQIAGSNLFQAVAQPVEQQQAPLPIGTYTGVFTCRVEESINGMYAFEMDVNGVVVGADKGNVNTTSDPHDSKVYKNQFILIVQ